MTYELKGTDELQYIEMTHQRGAKDVPAAAKSHPLWYYYIHVFRTNQPKRIDDATNSSCRGRTKLPKKNCALKN